MLNDAHLYYVIYYFIGLSYWSVNIFVRKLHTKNDPGDGWFLAPMWVILWPMCFTALFIVWMGNVRDKRQQKKLEKL